MSGNHAGRNFRPRGHYLAVGVSHREFDRLALSLDRGAGRLDRLPSAAGALELTSQVPFELLLVRSPLRDMKLEQFLEQVRGPGRPCQRSPLILLSAGDDAAAARYLGRGADRLVRLRDGDREIRAAISSLLAAASRRASRFKVRLDVRLSNFLDRVRCRTANISCSGMLVEARQRFDPGTKIRFDFALPRDVRRIDGIGEVVRHTVTGRDPVDGFALRNLCFAGRSQQRFEAYLESL